MGNRFHDSTPPLGSASIHKGIVYYDSTLQFIQEIDKTINNYFNFKSKRPICTTTTSQYIILEGQEGNDFVTNKVPLGFYPIGSQFTSVGILTNVIADYSDYRSPPKFIGDGIVYVDLYQDLFLEKKVFEQLEVKYLPKFNGKCHKRCCLCSQRLYQPPPLDTPFFDKYFIINGKHYARDNTYRNIRSRVDIPIGSNPNGFDQLPIGMASSLEDVPIGTADYNIPYYTKFRQVIDLGELLEMSLDTRLYLSKDFTPITNNNDLNITLKITKV